MISIKFYSFFGQTCLGRHTPRMSRHSFSEVHKEKACLMILLLTSAPYQAWQFRMVSAEFKKKSNLYAWLSFEQMGYMWISKIISRNWNWSIRICYQGMHKSQGYRWLKAWPSDSSSPREQRLLTGRAARTKRGKSFHLGQVSVRNSTGDFQWWHQARAIHRHSDFLWVI